MAMLTAGEFCNREVVIATRAVGVTEIARLMRDHHVGSVVVVEEKREGRVPVGIVTDRDIVMSVIATDPTHLAATNVDALLTGPLRVACKDEDIYDVMLLMRAYGIRRIPVVDAAGFLQGIIAFDDLLDHVADQLSMLVALLERQGTRERENRPALPATITGGVRYTGDDFARSHAPHAKPARRGSVPSGSRP